MAKFIGEDGAGNPQSTALKEIEMQIPGAWAKLQRTERSQHSSVEMNAPDRYILIRRVFLIDADRHQIRALFARRGGEKDHRGD